ncbi:MAG: phosphate ABC transporter substrate-binding protein PstS [Gemmataceae bacterium]|nr:phosphate ABC transporter substrate-binding protein PstS [Gemmataceae bacterium]
MRRLFAAALMAALVGCGKAPPADDGRGGTSGKADPKLDAELQGLEKAELNAQGATFIVPVMQYWTQEFLERKTGGKVRINYQGTGSGAGITAVTKKLAAFGGSDAPLNKAQLDEARAAGGEVVHVPLVVGAVVPVYNLPEVSEPLKFTGPVLADIFTGKVKRWNDPKLAALNPGVALPDRDIQPVYRADASGTSFVFADYLTKVDGEFRKTVGVSTAPKWPDTVGIRKPKSDGVAGYVEQTPGTIGYIELTYVLDKPGALKYGSVRNKAGKDVLADLAGITAAAEASLDQKPTAEPYSLHELTYNLTNPAGEKSYPIAATSFAVLYKGQKGPEGKAVVAFLKWATSDEGQAMAERRNFAPLPAGLRQKVAEKLAAVEVQ